MTAMSTNKETIVLCAYLCFIRPVVIACLISGSYLICFQTGKLYSVCTIDKLFTNGETPSALLINMMRKIVIEQQKIGLEKQTHVPELVTFTRIKKPDLSSFE